MAKAYPVCGTCPFTQPSTGTADATVWCHGAPPVATARPTGVDGQINITSQRPLLSKTLIGCGLHPDWPRRRKR